MRCALVVACSFLAFVSGGCTPRAHRPRNVVLLIGDGLGFSQIALARYAIAGKGGRLRLESLPVVGIVSTWSASNVVTDSGAAGTAFGGGVKTENQYIGLDSEKRAVSSLADAAKASGARVGLVTTTRITHATPACFYAHHDDRYDEEPLAEQLVASRVDLALGGGSYWFLPREQGGVRTDGRDLLAEARAAGWTVKERGAPLVWDGEGRLLGVFASGHLAYQLDDARHPAERRDPSLSAMTRLALEGLARGGDPFFLMVEGGRIDHAAHEFDAAGVVAETRAFDEAVAAVADWARGRTDTLVVLTADHATGGLALNDFSRWEALPRRTASNAWLAQQVMNAGAGAALVEEHTGVTLTPTELETLRTAPDLHEACRRLGRGMAERDGFTWLPRVDERDTKGHTGEDVPIFALGPGSKGFAGMLDNAEIASRIAELTGWRLAKPGS